MKASVLVDGKKLFLNPFMATLTANLVQAVARSLKSPRGRIIELRMLENKELSMLVDDQEVALNLGQAKRIVGNVLNGLLQSLHGTESCKEFRFIYEPDDDDV